MKISRAWLQKYFDTSLPATAELSDAFTFHAFEVEESTDDLIDLKVLPDRAAYGLSHRGIARELSAILSIPLSKDPLTEPLPQWKPTDAIALTIDTPKGNRHIGALVRGVRVGPSPEWLKSALEAVGQRSINNVVDATNYVTLNMGQPLHAFDAGKIAWDGDTLRIGVRETKGKESVPVLSGETYELPVGALVITEGKDGKPLDIAGIKGGMASAITEETKDLFVSVANFDAVSIRKTARALALWTDASLRFQNRISADLAAYGMRDILALITELAGGEVIGVNDVYPNKEVAAPQVTVSLSTINGKLGSSFTDEEVKGVFDRLGFAYTAQNETYEVTSPFERRDIVIPEDLVEEVGRVLGYDRIPPTEPSATEGTPDHARYQGIERIKDFLIERGFTEISTPSFDLTGEVLLSNPLQEDKPWLRANLSNNMKEALTRAVNVAPKVLGPTPALMLFELGNVFKKDGEHLSLAFGYRALTGKKQALLADVAVELTSLLGVNVVVSDDVAEVVLDAVPLEKLGEGYAVRKVSLEKFRPFSVYPFALRDIAVWTPAGTKTDEVSEAISKEVGDLLARIDLFDTFEKDGRTSYAFRLVFESFEKTLSDEDLNPTMEKVTAALNAKEGWEVR